MTLHPTDMSAEVIVLRLIHIVGGMFWVGGTMFMTFFLAPVLGGMGPGAGPVIGGLTKRRLPTWLAAAAGLTVLSGLRLIMIMSSGFKSEYFQSAVGQTFSIAAGIALLAFIIGMAVTRPAMTRAGALGQQLHGTTDEATRVRLAAELDAARRRGTTGGMIVMTLLLLAVAGMAVARYMG